MLLNLGSWRAPPEMQNHVFKVIKSTFTSLCLFHLLSLSDFNDTLWLGFPSKMDLLQTAKGGGPLPGLFFRMLFFCHLAKQAWRANCTVAKLHKFQLLWKATIDGESRRGTSNSKCSTLKIKIKNKSLFKGKNRNKSF